MMSSSWTELQGQVGNLQGKSKEELCEILRRQEKLLSNKKFVQSLPDKGKKITDFVQRLHLALARREEEEKRQDMLSDVKTEFQSKYQQALAQRQPGSHDLASGLDFLETSQKIMEHGHVDSEDVQLDQSGQDSADADGRKISPGIPEALGMETATDARHLGLSDGEKEKDLTGAFQRVTLADDDEPNPSLLKVRSYDAMMDNPFRKTRPQKKFHCIEVVERTENNLSTRKPKFKPNQLVQKADGSPSDSTASGQSPGGVSPLSAELRRQRDRMHLDDITAAKLPPLHHSPAQLLSLEESVSLLREQTRKYEELQAKVAAHKLSKWLGISMATYEPEVQIPGRYREACDHDDELSSNED